MKVKKKNLVIYQPGRCTTYTVSVCEAVDKEAETARRIDLPDWRWYRRYPVQQLCYFPDPSMLQSLMFACNNLRQDKTERRSSKPAMLPFELRLLPDVLHSNDPLVSATYYGQAELQSQSHCFQPFFFFLSGTASRASC